MTMDMLNTPVFNLMGRSDPLDLLACRACLKTDIKLFCLHKYGLAQTFGDVAGTTVSQSDGLPQYVCYVCVGLLQKSSAFRRRCRQAHIVVQNAYEHHLGITTDYVRTLDKSQLTLPLAVSKVNILTYLPSDEFDNENTEKTNFESETNFDFQEIKPEVFLNDIEDNYDYPQEDTSHHLHDDLDDDPQDDLPLKPSSGFTTQDLDVKSEEKIEPEKPVAKKRSLRDRDVKKGKSVKTSKKLPAKKQVAKKVKKEEIIKPEKEKRIEKEKKVKAKKNRYNQKFEEDFEGFAKMYNCEVVVLTKEQQIQRIQERHKTNGTGRLTCDICFKKFFTESAYKNHMQLHDPSSGEYICEVCQSRYPTKKALQRHARTHRLEFICKICNLVNKCTERAKLHYQWHQGMKHECEHCKKKFNAHSSKLNHVREHHTPAACKDCDKICSGTIELAKHRAKVHAEIRQPRHWYGKKKKQNNCETCGVEFLDAQALQRHRNLDNPCDERKKPCVICGFSFHSEQELTRHNTEKHYNSVFKCTACPATFTTDRKLGIHWKRFHIYQDPTADKPDGAPPARPAVTFMCEVCAKSYHTAGQLRIHQRIHTGEKPFKCPLCPKSFRDKTNVQVHINIHTGERPFKCRFCPETFKSYAQRYKHKLLVHTKERNYKCHMCEKTYIVSCDLKMHIRTAHMHIPRPPRNRNRNKVNNLIPKQQIENLTYNNPLNQPK